jgi:hypothetical protein
MLCICPKTRAASMGSLLLLLGCGSAAPVPEPASQDATKTSLVARADGTVLATLKMKTGHLVEIREYDPGEVVLIEAGSIDSPTAVTEELSALGSTQVLRDRLRPDLAPEQDPNLDEKLRALDDRIAKYVPPATSTAASAGPASDDGAEADSANYYYDWGADAVWFSQNYCAAPGYCYTNRSGYGYVQRGTGVKNWSCAIMNDDFSGTITATFSKWYSDIFGNAYWDPNWSGQVAARQIQRITNFTGNTVQRKCEANGAHWNLGAYWTPVTFSGPPPQPTCNYEVRAHTSTCYGLDGTVSHILSQCADACGTTLSEAQTNAALALGQSVCLGAYYGCCTYTTDQNFNVCGN